MWFLKGKSSKGDQKAIQQCRVIIKRNNIKKNQQYQRGFNDKLFQCNKEGSDSLVVLSMGRFPGGY